MFYLQILLLLWFVIFFDCVLRYVRQTFYYGKSTVQTVTTTAAKWQPNERPRARAPRTTHEHKPNAFTNERADRRQQAVKQRSSCAAAVAVVAYITAVGPSLLLAACDVTRTSPQVFPYHGETTGWLWLGWSAFSLLAIKFKCATSDDHNNKNNISNKNSNNNVNRRMWTWTH